MYSRAFLAVVCLSSLAYALLSLPLLTKWDFVVGLIVSMVCLIGWGELERRARWLRGREGVWARRDVEAILREQNSWGRR